MKNFQKIVDFIRELYQEDEAFIPLHAPVFLGNEKLYLNECIDSTFVSSVGKYVDQFEQVTANYVGAKHAIAVVNGTAALQIALILAGTQPGDEVITQSLTFVATCNAIKHAGANPVFVDVDKDTLGMSPKSLEKWLGENTELRLDKVSANKVCVNKKTGNRISAILPMHTFGHPCRITEIVRIADNYNIPVVEDSAESIGSYYEGKHTGTFGSVGIFSYNGNKTITTGGGGMIITDNTDFAIRAKHLTTTAKVSHAYNFEHDEIGYNFRLPNINAALGVAQMEMLDNILVSKRNVANAYKSFFEGGNYQFFQEPKGCSSNYWLNVLILDNAEEKEAFLNFTNDNKVMTRPAWKLMHELKMFENCNLADLSNSKWLANRIVNIPSGVK